MHASPLPICTSTKDLNFLGSEIPLFFYFIEISLLLMVISIFVGTGEFVMCTINDTCRVDLYVRFAFL